MKRLSDIFAEKTGMDREDALFWDAYHAWLSSGYHILEWWAEHQGEYV